MEQFKPKKQPKVEPQEFKMLKDIVAELSFNVTLLQTKVTELTKWKQEHQERTDLHQGNIK